MPSQTPESFEKFERQKRRLLCTHVVISLAFGVLIGFFVDDNVNISNKTQTTTPAELNTTPESTTPEVTTLGLNDVDILSEYRYFNYQITTSGSKVENHVIDFLMRSWRRCGVDMVCLKTYNTLHSFSNLTSPNLVIILSHRGEEQHRSKYQIPKHETYPPYCAFSRAGMVEGQLVYVNYGREEDFQLLVNNYSISVAGKIVIARNNKISFGDKVKNSEHFNVSGVILYSDPADYNLNEVSSALKTHFFLQGSSVRRDTLEIDGDLLTPFYPALDYAKRRSRTNLPMFKIPVQPISYDDAQIFLNELEGEEAPSAWQGRLPIKYRIGEGLRNKQAIRLTVNNEESMRMSSNLIGFVRGSEEPDRYVMIGSSHDSWVYGAIDPKTAGHVMHLMIPKIAYAAKFQGKRPKRSIAFCSWGATEQGLLGSTEFVEEHLKMLQDRAVAYLHMTYACEYPYVLEAHISPLLQDALYEAAKKVPNPDEDSRYKTLYDLWKHRAPQNTSEGELEPSVSYVLGNNADLKPFYTRAGVASANVWYTFDKKKWKIPHFPSYHSDQDVPHFDSYLKKCLTSMEKLMTELLWSLADDDILPINTLRYAAAISIAVKGLKQDFGDLWRQHDIKIALYTTTTHEKLKLRIADIVKVAFFHKNSSRRYKFLVNHPLDAFDSAVENLTSRARTFHDEITNITSMGALERRIINDKLMQFEKVFIDPEGLPGRRLYKHVVFSPSIHPGYSDKFFPGIVDTMVDIIKRGEDKWNILRQQIFIATFTIQSAANFLNDANF